MVRVIFIPGAGVAIISTSVTETEGLLNAARFALGCADSQEAPKTV